MNECNKVALSDGGFLQASFLAGPANAPLIVLSNSAMTDMRIWEEQAGVLSKGYSVLQYDQRGHGQSSIPTSTMTFDHFGADIVTLLDAFDVKKCIFIGLSMGVPSGLAALMQAPDRFQAFVAVDGVSKSAHGREAFWRERRETARECGMAQIADETVDRWIVGEGDVNDQVSRLREIVASTPVEGFAGATYALQNYDYSAGLSELSLPFMSIAGSEDGAMPDAMKKQFGAIQGAKFETIKQAGHVPNFQRPDAFNEVVLPFLRSI